MSAHSAAARAVVGDEWVPCDKQHAADPTISTLLSCHARERQHVHIFWDQGRSKERPRYAADRRAAFESRRKDHGINWNESFGGDVLCPQSAKTLVPRHGIPEDRLVEDMTGQQCGRKLSVLVDAAPFTHQFLHVVDQIVIRILHSGRTKKEARACAESTIEMSPNMSLFSVNAILVLSSDDSSRILAKYYSPPHIPANAHGNNYPGANPYPTVKEQKAFEKGLLEKTAKQTSDIILYDNKIVVFKMESDVMLYVVGGADENEIMLYSVVLALRDSLNILLKYARPLDRRNSINATN